MFDRLLAFLSSSGISNKNRVNSQWSGLVRQSIALLLIYSTTAITMPVHGEEVPAHDSQWSNSGVGQIHTPTIEKALASRLEKGITTRVPSDSGLRGGNLSGFFISDRLIINGSVGEAAGQRISHHFDRSCHAGRAHHFATSSDFVGQPECLGARFSL